ncbi:MAG: PD40 domain-containing protein [Bacteroidetes bacterium]|nr:PD40 domain-containing protein [Bacteroidota bacterium]
MRKSTILQVFTTFIIIVIAITTGFSQDKNEKKLSSKADRYFINSQYGKAIDAYTELLKLNPTNFDYNYKKGISLYFSNKASDILKASPYFEAAYANMGKDTTPEIYYYLGQTLQIAGKFDEAIKYYEILKAYTGNSQSNIKDVEEIDNYIKQCNYAKQFIKMPVPVKITNMGPNINTEYRDYAPVISGDESRLIFTSKRKGSTGGRIADDGRYFEDIFISKRTNKTTKDWTISSKLDTNNALNFFQLWFNKAENIGKGINSSDHDASIALSPDGKTLYMYKLNDIWQSTYDGKKWSKPNRLNGNVNSKQYHEPSVSQSADGKTLYVVSERKGGLGGKDIYKSVKDEEGEWGPLENLGPEINTRFDEDGPFIHPDGKTLFFSSEGWNSMGGFDIFKSTLENGKWTTPINIGYPINTSADDIFFVMNEKGDRAYYATIVKDDNYGDLDIYMVSPQDVPNLSSNLLAYVGVDSATLAKTLISTGIVIPGIDDGTGKKVRLMSLTKNNNQPFDAKLKIANININPDNNEYISQMSTGNNIIGLTPGESYNMSIERAGYPSHSIDFYVPKNSSTRRYYQEIVFEDIKDDSGNIIGQKTTVYNGLFNIDSMVVADANLSALSKEEAYAAVIRKLDPENSGQNLKIYSFTDYTQVVAATTNTNTATQSVEGCIENLPTYNPVLFDFNQSVIKGDGARQMEEIYTLLSKHDCLNLEITGHTDSKGTDQYNLSLSQRRSSAAKKYFVDKGIASKRIKTVGKGESQPIAANENPDKTDNPDGRQLNRRVEFKFIPVKKSK